MLLKEAQPTLQRLRRHEPAVVAMIRPALSDSLRELAVRAHRLVRSTDELRSQPRSDADPGYLFNLEQELFELRSEIARLERRLQSAEPRRSCRVCLRPSAASRGISRLITPRGDERRDERQPSSPSSLKRPGRVSRQSSRHNHLNLTPRCPARPDSIS